MFESNSTSAQPIAQSLDDETLPSRDLARIRFLTGRNRALAEMRLKSRLTHRQIGLALDLDPGSVCRRVGRLVARLRDPIVWALTDSRCNLTESHRRIGLEFFLHGIPVNHIAQKRGLTRQQIGAVITYIRGWVSAASVTRLAQSESIFNPERGSS